MRQPVAKKAADTANPCVRNCCLNAEDVCMGCGRKLQEILRWHQLDETTRQLILERAAKLLTLKPAP